MQLLHRKLRFLAESEHTNQLAEAVFNDRRHRVLKRLDALSIAALSHQLVQLGARRHPVFVYLVDLAILDQVEHQVVLRLAVLVV